MRRDILGTAVVLGIMFTQLTAPATAAEKWEATSTTSMAITGNITFTPDRITFQNGANLPLALVGHAAAFDAHGQHVPADLYRVTAPTDPLLLGRNRLCGGGPRQKPITYIAVWTLPASGGREGRGIDVFSSAAPPPPAGNRTDECGTYFYETAAAVTPGPAANPTTSPGQTQCPPVLSGRPLSTVDVFDGPPVDGYSITPNTPPHRNVWNSLNNSNKPHFLVCYYGSQQARQQFQLPAGTRGCVGVRSADDMRIESMTCQ